VVFAEYTGLTALKSTDGGANWHFIAPADPDALFIALIDMDRTNPSHLRRCGAIVAELEAGVAGTTGEPAPRRTGSPSSTSGALGGNATSQVTALTP
jgi:hypothetical protein